MKKFLSACFYFIMVVPICILTLMVTALTLLFAIPILIVIGIIGIFVVAFEK